MNYAEAQEFVGEVVTMAEERGIDHHDVTETRKGGQRYLEVTLSIKVE